VARVAQSITVTTPIGSGQLIACPGSKIAGIIIGAITGGLLLILLVWFIIKKYPKWRAKRSGGGSLVRNDWEDPYPSYREPPPIPWYKRLISSKYKPVANPQKSPIDPGPYQPPRTSAQHISNPFEDPRGKGDRRNNLKSDYSAPSSAPVVRNGAPSQTPFRSPPYEYPSYPSSDSTRFGEKSPVPTRYHYSPSVPQPPRQVHMDRHPAKG